MNDPVAIPTDLGGLLSFAHQDQNAKHAAAIEAALWEHAKRRAAVVAERVDRHDTYASTFACDIADITRAISVVRAKARRETSAA